MSNNKIFVKSNNQTGYYNNNNNNNNNNQTLKKSNNHNGYNNNQNSYNKNHNGYKNQNNYNNKIIDTEISIWIQNINNLNTAESISIYEINKQSWNNSKKFLLKLLTKKHKFKVLDIILKNMDCHSDLTETNSHTNYTLLNENVWFNNIE